MRNAKLGNHLKAGFHQRRSRSWSHNQKRRAIRSCENETDGVRSRALVQLMSQSLLIKCKLHCQSRKQKWKNKPMTIFDSGPCDWLVLMLLFSTLTTWFSLDHKWRSSKWNRKKWKHFDSSNSDFFKVMTAYGHDFLFLQGHKVSYDFEYGSDSVASENQP